MRCFFPLNKKFLLLSEPAARAKARAVWFLKQKWFIDCNCTGDDLLHDLYIDHARIQRSVQSHPQQHIGFGASRGGYVAEVEDIDPAEGPEQLRYLVFRIRVVPADEDVVIAVCDLQRMCHHAGGHGVQSFDHFRHRKGTLDLLGERIFAKDRQRGRETI